MLHFLLRKMLRDFRKSWELNLMRSIWYLLRKDDKLLGTCVSLLFVCQSWSLLNLTDACYWQESFLQLKIVRDLSLLYFIMEYPFAMESSIKNVSPSCWHRIVAFLLITHKTIKLWSCIPRAFNFSALGALGLNLFAFGQKDPKKGS
jgi:hypothetical protein